MYYDQNKFLETMEGKRPASETSGMARAESKIEHMFKGGDASMCPFL